jgi:peroxiredoxin
MKTLKEQTDAKIAAGRKAKPEFMKSIDDMISKEKSFKRGDDAIQIGTSAPNFVLPNAVGKEISLVNLLVSGPIVVIFYRGDWCPYCNLQLRALQSRIEDIKASGAQLVAISPQVPDGSLSENEISNLDFIVLSDQDAKVAKEYGVAWKAPAVVLDHMRIDRSLDLESINNGNGTILPIPSTFIIGKNGKVVWNYIDVDYRTRSEPEDIIKALQEINKQKE